MKKPKFPKRCVYCNGDDFESSYLHDGEDLHETCECLDCGKSWTRIYEYVDFETEED